ncbi:ATP-grasp domain-containing protein [Chryseobacterium chendengshani]|uniref:ATP-grasp domain-containing protein n=1 Tax=Chryseobacterium sp. LJ668 TaxID=2864040 RepID=UPI001C693D79|nr:ATP-grasp domain-containing protein [Chryseobacterium sp. LJ668]MBW8523172.1 ATP-grasp domain-containing protein [Chryseobacterium sp. LJ668]QYK15469.1 ATP-grasp domain-containing protein [Chryseobacterium sp. LJ668]
MESKNIFVTGAGALLGQGILRMLQLCDFEKKIYTGDPDARSTGHWLGDHALYVPKASDDNYISAVKKIVEKYNIDAILVGTDTELVKLAEVHDEFLENYNCKIVVSNSNVIKISNDKFLTAEFLKENNFPYPVSKMANSMEDLLALERELGLPLFAKPIDGARSLGLVKINTHQDLVDIYDEKSNLVVQQFLPDTEGEYTSGCIVLNGKCVSIVSLKRDLRDGNTYRTYRDESTSQYDHIISKIAEVLKPDGPVNFQFRILNGEPVIFEINGRFSGTTPLRYFYGINEVEIILNYYLYGKIPVNTQLKSGVVMRAWSDLFIENEEMEKFNHDKELESPKAHFYNFNLKS